MRGRSQLLWLLVVFTRLGLALSCGKPNILFILADDLGVGDTSIPRYAASSGVYQIKTPNLERMANNGAAFLRAYAPAPVCGPSRYSFLSGRHTGHIQIRGNTGKGEDFTIPCSSREEDILAKVLQANGYHTAVIGKWGFKNHPFECGFDKFYGQLTHVDAHSFFPTRMHNNVIEQPDVRHENLYLPKNRFAKEQLCTASLNNCNFTHDMFTHEAEKYIRERATKSDPFFLFLSYSTPHVGSWRASENIFKYRDKLHMVAPVSTCPTDIVIPSTSNRLEECRHKAAVENYLDRDVGVMLDLLEELSLSSNTLVAFAADNGPDFSIKLDGRDIHTRIFKSAGLRRGQKRDLYEGGILTPFIMQWPGRIVPQGMYSQLASITDLFSTFLAASKSESLLKHPEVIDGISLLPIMAGESGCGSLDCCSYTSGPIEHEYLFWEYCDQQVANWKKIAKDPDGLCSKAVHSRQGFKLLYNHHTKGYELYEADPNRNYLVEETRSLPASHPQFEHLKMIMQHSRIPLLVSGYRGGTVIGEHIFTPFPTTAAPSYFPTLNPTTLSPTQDPTTLSPTAFPTTPIPTTQPTREPTAEPTGQPTFEPTYEPVTDPTHSPTPRPTFQPTSQPITAAPTFIPSSEPTHATETPTNSPMVPTPEPTGFDLSRARCGDSGQISIKTRVETDGRCMDLCRETSDCQFLSYSQECNCCLLYRACDQWTYESSGRFDDWVTSTVLFTEAPTRLPTQAPVRNTTGTLDRNVLVESGVLGVAAIVTTLCLVLLLIGCIVFAKYNKTRDRTQKRDDFSRTDSSEGSSDESFETA